MKTALQTRGFTSFQGLIFLFAIFFGSCKSSDMGLDDGKQNRLVVNYSMVTPSTKAFATEDENKIYEIAVMFFASNTGAYSTSIVQDISSTGSSSGDFTIVLPEDLVANTDYKTLVVANYDEFLTSGINTTADYITSVTNDAGNLPTFEEMKRDMISGLGNGSDYDRRISTPLLFSGESSFKTPTVNSTDQVNIDVPLYRTMSRIDVYSAAGNLDIDWIKVCNYRTEGHPYHQDILTGGIIRGFSTSTSTADRSVIEATGSAGSQSVVGGLYAYPNTSVYPAQNDEATTCILIKGKYNNSQTPTYYRVNIVGKNKAQLLRRNGLYQLRINQVFMEGESTEQDALEGLSNKLDYDINDWDEDYTQGVATDVNGNYITLSSTELIFERTANGVHTIDVGVREGTFWNPTFLDNPDGLYTLEIISPTSFRVTVPTENTTASSRNAKIRVEVSNTNGTDLYLDVNCVQLSHSGDYTMLTVDGQSEALSFEIPANGGRVRLPVLTGSSEVDWRSLADANFSDISGATYTASGANRAILEIKLPANIVASRSGTITVYRNNSEGIVAPVEITVTQTMASRVITLDPTWVERIDAEGISGTKELTRRYKITLAAPDQYTWKATSNFPKSVLTISTDNATSDSDIATGGNNQYLKIHFIGRAVERPDGADSSEGTIEIELVAKPTVPANTKTNSLTLNVYSSYVLPDQTKGEYVRVGNLEIYDRNIGVDVPTPETEPYAKYFTYTDQTQNFDWRGDYFTWDEVLATDPLRPNEHKICPVGWRVPNNTDIAAMIEAAKRIQLRTVIPSDAANSNGKILCTHMPLSGSLHNGTIRYHTFYAIDSPSTTKPAFWIQSGGAVGIHPGSGQLNDALLCRCVRTYVPAGTTTP